MPRAKRRGDRHAGGRPVTTGAGKTPRVSFALSSELVARLEARGKRSGRSPGVEAKAIVTAALEREAG